MAVILHAGWFPGVVGDIAARQYAASHGFGAVFEAKMARRLGEFLARPLQPGDFSGAVEAEGRALGSNALKNESEGLAGLRWFILDASLRGSGMGRRLLNEALAHARGLRRDRAADRHAMGGVATTELRLELSL